MCGGREGTPRKGGGILAEQIVEDLILGSSSNGGSYPVASTIVNLMKDDVCWAKEGAEAGKMGRREAGWDTETEQNLSSCLRAAAASSSVC